MAALVSVVLGAVLAIDAVAVAALHSELPSNPWHQTLRRYFTQLQAPA